MDPYAGLSASAYSEEVEALHAETGVNRTVLRRLLWLHGGDASYVCSVICTDNDAADEYDDYTHNACVRVDDDVYDYIMVGEIGEVWRDGGANEAETDHCAAVVGDQICQLIPFTLPTTTTTTITTMTTLTSTWERGESSAMGAQRLQHERQAEPSLLINKRRSYESDSDTCTPLKSTLVATAGSPKTNGESPTSVLDFNEASHSRLAHVKKRIRVSVEENDPTCRRLQPS
eukprot:jgi/Chlat1/6170/Chrsp41S05707